MTDLNAIRKQIRELHLADDDTVLKLFRGTNDAGLAERSVIKTRATDLVNAIRNDSAPGIMEVFLAEYGLSTDEGVALMCLAEALLRVPDSETIDALIEDKIAPSKWGAHLGKSSSPLVNASTWALMITGKVLNEGEGIASVLRGAIKRVGEPIIRTAVGHAMRELGAQFVLGETIEAAVDRGTTKQAEGFTYSFDMLGEAALCADDAQAFFDAYAHAISVLAHHAASDDIRQNPGISIKLSALHPRYEQSQRERVLEELVPRVIDLAKRAKAAKIGLNIDAEEADRLELSLDVIEAALSDASLSGWDGFGIVVQAYGKRASKVIDWFYALASHLDRKVMVRLVKGAYWDSEIKRAQVEGLQGFPVFTQKAATDISFMACSNQLLAMSDRIYPQFATHNAHSVAAILAMNPSEDSFEFQRLHGMGEALHDVVFATEGTRCRIYAPVGAHEDLLAYLVRRLLENGANSSFVNQIVDTDVPAEIVAADPVETLAQSNAFVRHPSALFLPERVNSKGWDLHDARDIDLVYKARASFLTQSWRAQPILMHSSSGGEVITVHNPARPAEKLGEVQFASQADVEQAIDAATPWNAEAEQRAAILNKAADLYEEQFGELFALLTKEAGKTQNDAIAELREAVDFLRYYAARCPELPNPARGIFTCISPWNFPLAIFTGQIAAALAAGNAVLAKPAEATNLIAARATQLLHQAGVPPASLQLLPGRGDQVGKALTSDPRIDGVCFTGSTWTAKHIDQAMAHHLDPVAPLIAETGGLNAMIVDSTALPEQAVKDIVVSAFQSAGQRCSALRVLYLQEDIKEPFLNMLFGAMDELKIGNPWDFDTDIGPAIDPEAQAKIAAHIETAQAEGRLLKSLPIPEDGHFVAPSVLRLNSILDLKEEVFGPVLHVVTFDPENLPGVLEDINATGYGLTFGLHTRIDDRVDYVTKTLNVGNMYINRNQIGAIVGSQPFGGEGLSGTGPKAGGAAYLPRFTKPAGFKEKSHAGAPVDLDALQAHLSTLSDVRMPIDDYQLPGPTGESNQITRMGRGVVLCLGPSRRAAMDQARAAKAAGCTPVCIAPDLDHSDGFQGELNPQDLTGLSQIAAVIYAGDDEKRSLYRQAVARRDGPIVPLICETNLDARLTMERHVCIDTTASGGNASLLAQS